MMHTLKRLAQDGLDAIRRKESDVFLGVVKVFQEALDALAQSATLEAIDVLPEAFKQEIDDLGGATKISGAGGDVALIFYRDVAAAAALKVCVAKHGFNMLPLEPSIEPLRLNLKSDDLKS
jgi:mevalonate kinase